MVLSPKLDIESCKSV